MLRIQAITKTSPRIDDEGLLSPRFLMPSPSPKLGKRDEGPAAFIEFRVSLQISFRTLGSSVMSVFSAGLSRTVCFY